MKRQLVVLAASTAMIAVVCWSVPRRASSQANHDQAVKLAYEAYVQAWKITTGKGDDEWISMCADEIHTHVFGNTAIATGLLSAQEKRTDETIFSARVRFLAALVKHDGVWQLVATQSTPIKPPQHGSN